MELIGVLNFDCSQSQSVRVCLACFKELCDICIILDVPHFLYHL